MITCHPFKLESPNLDQKCILIQLRLLFDFGLHKLSASLSFLYSRTKGAYRQGNSLSPNLRPECRSIVTRQLEALTVPSMHCVANNCIYFQSHLLAGTNSIAIDLMTMKDYFFSASATSNPPFLVGCCDCW